MLIYPVEADVLVFLKSIVEALQPFARAHSVALSFERKFSKLHLNYHPETIVSDLMQLLCRIITFTPQNQSVKLSVELVDSYNDFYLKLLIENTGVNLLTIKEIINSCKNTIIVHSGAENATTFELQWQLEKPIEFSSTNALTLIHPPDSVRGFYAGVRDKMKFYFNRQENRMAVLLAKNPDDAIFLQKVNAVINANIEKEDFDIDQLARSMAIGRMQLHRKLKPLVNQSPAHYIRDTRLIKAKTMIQTEDLSIGEICFKVGFQSQSHFTRVFIEKFGVRPTSYKKMRE